MLDPVLRDEYTYEIDFETVIKAKGSRSTRSDVLTYLVSISCLKEGTYQVDIIVEPISGLSEQLETEWVTISLVGE